MASVTKQAVFPYKRAFMLLNLNKLPEAEPFSSRWRPPPDYWVNQIFPERRTHRQLFVSKRTDCTLIQVYRKIPPIPRYTQDEILLPCSQQPTCHFFSPFSARLILHIPSHSINPSTHTSTKLFISTRFPNQKYLCVLFLTIRATRLTLLFDDSVSQITFSEERNS